MGRACAAIAFGDALRLHYRKFTERDVVAIVDLKQTDDQLAGPRRGPNGGCSAVGVVNGPNVDLTCRTSYTNPPNLAGVSTFHGALGGDEIVRGSCTHSRLPGASGVFAMMRV